MKKILFLFLCFCGNLAFAQVVLTNATNGFIPGYSAWFYYNWGVNPGYYPVTANYTNSANEIWDFHDMTTTLSQRDDFTYCGFDSTRVSSLLWSCVVNTNDYIIDRGIYFTFNVPDSLMKFPLQLGDSFGGSFHAIAPVTTSYTFHTVYGYRTTVADARGTLILPHGTYDDVLRLKTISESTDTLHNTIDTLYKRRSVQYKWYSPSQREFLLMIDTSYYLNTTFSPFWDKDILSGYVLGFPVKVKDPLNSSEIKLYPSPVATELTVSAANKISRVVIYNFLGQIMYDKQHNSTQVQIDVSNFSTGFYSMKINDAEVRKFMKQ